MPFEYHQLSLVTNRAKSHIARTTAQLVGWRGGRRIDRGLPKREQTSRSRQSSTGISAHTEQPSQRGLARLGGGHQTTSRSREHASRQLQRRCRALELPRGLSARGAAFTLGGAKIYVVVSEPTTSDAKLLDPDILFPTLPYTLEHL
jgi:hypothetical protein